jgi:hypothetical protein
MKFYEFCKNNPNLDNLPRFSDEAQAFQADGKNYVMFTMERLKPIPRESFEEAMVWILSDYATKKLSWNTVVKRLKNYDPGLGPSDEDVEVILAKGIFFLDRKKWLEYEVLYKLMVLLYHKGRINKAGWDLHTENVMMRGDTLVITDPWFIDSLNT